MNHLSRGILGATIVVMSWAWAAQCDEVWLVRKEGSPVKEDKPQIGRVETDDCDWVEMVTAQNAKTKFPQKDVRKIVYEMTPISFTNAENSKGLGNYDRAIDAYTEALDDRHNKLLTQYIYYGLAECYMATNNPADAEAQLEKLLAEVPRTKFLYSAKDMLIRLYIQEQKWDKVQRLINEMKAQDPENASYLLGYVMEQKKDYAGAAKEYARLINITEGGNAKIYWQAKAGLLRCTFLLNKMAELETQIKDIISRPEEAPLDTMASSYYYSGLLNIEKGKTNPDRYDDALENFVRVFVLYDSPASRELAAEACFRASELCDLISTRNHPELKSDAKLLLRYCARTYKESDWGKKAAEKAR